jgi:hypothetical protein
MTRTFSSALIIRLGFITGIAQASTFTVINTSDSGVGSLRQAIIDANNNAGADTIAFNISGTGVHTISPLTALLAITEAVTIDGYTQPGSSANTHATTQGLNTVLKIELNGVNSGSNFSGLTINADNCTVRGLVIDSFVHNGIDINASSAVIEGDFIGTDPTGTIARPNGSGGNGGIILGNGTPSDCTIGGTTPAARNLISGNVGPGVNTGTGTGNTVQGNLIGTDVTGTLALGNTDRGVFVNGSNNIVGGTTVAARNIISANGRGVDLFGGSNNTVQGNFIGTDVTGTIALSNPNVGLDVNGTSNNVIGGLTATPGTPPGNLISGNNGNDGVILGGGTTGNLIQGNIIGADITGTQPLGNTPGGIMINGHDNMVGGTDPNARNIIAFNGGSSPMCNATVAGIWVHNSPAVNNAILGNSIFSNAGLGIDLAFDGDPNCGVEPNDTGDGDSGPNNLQNYPVLETVSNGGGMTTVTGRLNSAANTMYRIEFFANNPLDPTGYGEGQTFLGFKDVTTGAGGNANFNQSFPQLAANQYVTATATDANGNTSEFSGAIGQLLNISTRMEVLTGNSVLIGGFIVTGNGNKDVLLRALGPTLHNFGINDFLADPTLDLYSGATLLASNDDWKTTQQAAIMATGKAPPDDKEAAIRHTFTAGNYTAIVRGKKSTTGVALIEAYDIDEDAATTLTNISTRGFVETGANVMIGGFIGGHGIVRVIVRALGPTLSQFGVTSVLADPMLELHDANGALLASNDDWQSSQQA